MLLRAFVMVCFAVLTSVAPLQAQPGSVADMHRVVVDAMRTDPDHVDPAATVRLGVLYLQGQVVPMDRERGCGLLYLAATNDVFQHPGVASRLEDVLNEHCTAAERDAANAWLNCWEFGPAYPVIIELDAGYWVELAAKSVRIQTPGGSFDRERSAACYRNTVSIRHVHIDPSGGSSRSPRHLIESYSWQSWLQDGQPVRELRWSLEEVKGSEWNLVADERLVMEPGSSWPVPKISRELRNVRLRMDRVAKITYWIGGKNRGTID